MFKVNAKEKFKWIVVLFWQAALEADMVFPNENVFDNALGKIFKDQFHQVSRLMFLSLDIQGDAAAKEVAEATRRFLLITRAKIAVILDTATIRYHLSCDQ
ncbi:hypothetical protein RvVAT039_pl07220 (plasmid) [Agrobacterium vitis]|nr:hypothetical protein RvVAT039_pl07220 [Agrobacterium vitis]